MEVKLNLVSVIEARLGIQNRGPAHAFFTAECARQMDRFVPFDKGTLAETVVVNGQVTDKVGIDTIHYDQQYAKVVYYGIRNNMPITIHKTKHKDATTYWDKHMWTAKGQDVIKAVQNYVDTHGGK